MEYRRYTKPENGYNRKPKNISVKNKTIKYTTDFPVLYADDKNEVENMDMITENPCKFCIDGANNLNFGCLNNRKCEMLSAYHKYLKFFKEAKYKVGEKITSLDELNQCEWVFDTMRKHPISIQTIRELRFYSVIFELQHGHYRKVEIRKE